MKESDMKTRKITLLSLVGVVIFTLPVFPQKSYPIEENTFYGSTTCLTNILGNDVNVRDFPSLEAKVVHRLQKNDVVRIIGFSDEKMTIDNFTGNWVNIRYEKDKYIDGWIFSKYANTGGKNFSPIKFIELMPEQYGSRRIKLSYTLQGKEIFVETKYTEMNNYYVIVWSGYNKDFHYTNKPGVYTLNKKTNELKHITYLGAHLGYGAIDDPRATLFTDDFKYIIQVYPTDDIGDSGIRAWRCSDRKEIFSNDDYYDNSIKIYGHIIEIAVFGGYDEELKSYEKNYREKNKVPKEMEDEVKKDQLGILGVSLLIKYSLDLDTGKRKILGAKYIIK